MKHERNCYVTSQYASAGAPTSMVPTGNIVIPISDVYLGK
jgi:hypothetical protein